MHDRFANSAPQFRWRPGFGSLSSFPPDQHAMHAQCLDLICDVIQPLCEMPLPSVHTGKAQENRGTSRNWDDVRSGTVACKRQESIPNDCLTLELVDVKLMASPRFSRTTDIIVVIIEKSDA